MSVLTRLFDEVSPEVANALATALSGSEMSPAQAELLLNAEGADFHAPPLMQSGKVCI